MKIDYRTKVREDDIWNRNIVKKGMDFPMLGGDEKEDSKKERKLGLYEFPRPLCKEKAFW